LVQGVEIHSRFFGFRRVRYAWRHQYSAAEAHGFADSINDERSALKAIAEEQARIRANIERVPRDSDAFKRYLRKFDDQETEIERRQSKVTEVQAALDARMKAFAEFVKGLKAAEYGSLFERAEHRRRRQLVRPTPSHRHGSHAIVTPNRDGIY
jgi:hypothetical protein